MWTEIANFGLLTLALAVAVPLTVFSLEVWLALLPSRRRTALPRPDGSRAVVLIPAHNEAAGIRQTLQLLKPSLDAGDSILVVADNCCDGTAQIAREEGANVLERFDERRGKGYALADGIEHLAEQPPDVVIVLDADCQTHPELVRRLVAEVAATGEPAQAHDRFRSPDGSGPLNAVSELALQFRGYIRPRGAARLGAPCSLYGTGMAFPWRTVCNRSMGGDHLVEDMQFGIELMLEGHRPRFCPDVSVLSDLPATEQGFMSQRTRWETGHLQTLITQAPRLMAAAVRQRSVPLLWAALALTVPPLALLTIVWGTLMLLTAGLAWFGIGHVASIILATAGTVFAVSILAGWTAFCREQIPLRVLAMVPAYLVRKLPLYWKMATNPQRRWVRTPRDVT